MERCRLVMEVTRLVAGEDANRGRKKKMLFWEMSGVVNNSQA